MTDYFRALLLRHAAVSEDLAGHPFGELRDPFALAPSVPGAAAPIDAPLRDAWSAPTGFARRSAPVPLGVATARAIDGQGPVPTPAAPPLPGNPAVATAAPSASATSADPPPRQPLRPTERDEIPAPGWRAVTAGLPAARSRRDQPLADDAATADSAEASALDRGESLGAGAGLARPAAGSPPLRTGRVDAAIDAAPAAEAASIPPLPPHIAAGRYALPRAIDPRQAVAERDRALPPVGATPSEMPEPARQGIAAAMPREPSPYRLPPAEAHGEKASIPPPVPEMAAIREPPGPPVPEVLRRDPELVMSPADAATPDARVEHEGAPPPAAGNVSGVLSMPAPHTALRDLPPAVAAVAPALARRTAIAMAGRPQAAAAAVQASAAAEAALPLPPLPASPPQAGTDTPKIGIRVSIDRLELHAAAPPPGRPAPPRQAPTGRRVGLDDYAARRRASAPS